MAKDVLRAADGAARLLCRALIVLIGCMLVFLIAIFGWLVFGRYVLNVTPTWVEQMALLLVIWITFLGAAVGIYEETHLGVTFIRDGLPRRLRRFLHSVGDAMLAAFGLVMVIACAELVVFGWGTQLAMLNIPESFRSLPAALCGGLVCAFSVLKLLLRIAGLSPDAPDVAVA